MQFDCEQDFREEPTKRLDVSFWRTTSIMEKSKAVSSGVLGLSFWKGFWRTPALFNCRVAEDGDGGVPFAPIEGSRLQKVLRRLYGLNDELGCLR